jgi:hypothetical protein
MLVDMVCERETSQAFGKFRMLATEIAQAVIKERQACGNHRACRETLPHESNHATLSIAAYGFLVAERSRFSPAARAGQVDLPVPKMPRQYRPRGSPSGWGGA